MTVHMVSKGILSGEFDHKCEDDHQSYQACGFSFHQNTFKSYKNAICYWRVYIDDQDKVKAEMVEDNPTPRISNNTVVLPSGEVTSRDYICNDRCDRGEL